MIGIYLSGTGNTKHCMERLIAEIDSGVKLLPLEDEETVVDEIKKNSVIYIGYPTQFSNIPYMVRDFLLRHADLWEGKQIFCLNTFGLFSGDGTGCAARILQKYGATILGGMEIQMPDSVCDSKLLKRTLEENRAIVEAADKKIDRAAAAIRRGKYPQEGLSVFAHLAGLFGQRLWFYGKTAGYSDRLKINEDCIGCGLCVSQCPMKNLSLVDGKIISGNRCTMCYRCISHCPVQAMTLLGKKVVEQCTFEKYGKQ